MPTTIECDVCIVGGGISAALFAEKFSELVPGRRLVVVEAGARLFDLENRMQYRERNLQYRGECMAGRLHRRSSCRRHHLAHDGRRRIGDALGRARESFFSRGPASPFAVRARHRLAVDVGRSRAGTTARRTAGSASPAIRARIRKIAARSRTRCRRCRCPTVFDTSRAWAEQSGIPFQSCPQAKNTQPYDGRSICKRCNTCNICPTGARYSPDFTFKRLLATKRIALHDRTLVRRLIPEPHGGGIAAAEAVHPDRPGETTLYRAHTFVLASGYTWSPHLLLLSASPRYPDGLANRSGMVGRYMTGHPFVTAQVEVDGPFYPGMNEHHPLISREFFRCRPDRPYVRYDIQIFESTANHQPRLREPGGRYLFGNDLVADWRLRASRGSARVRMYYDAHPDRESRLSLDSATRNRWGDPLPASNTDSIPRPSHGRNRRTSTSAQRTTGSPALATRRYSPSLTAPTSIIHPAAAEWAPTRRRASATVMGAPTITPTSSSSARRRSRPAAARTQR